MFELVDSLGRKLFESISITLVCGMGSPYRCSLKPVTHIHPCSTDDCMQTETPEKCTHKLAEMPRWLSSTKMETVKALLSVCVPTVAHSLFTVPETSICVNRRTQLCCMRHAIPCLWVELDRDLYF